MKSISTPAGHRAPSRCGFTLLELLAVIAAVGVLGTLLIIASGRVRSMADNAACLGNLRQWGVALQLYIGEHGGDLPRRGQGVRPVWMVDRGEDWINALPPYLGLPSYQKLYEDGEAPEPGDHSVFVCPTAEDSGHQHFISYGMNMYLSPWIRPTPHNAYELPDTSALAFLADGPCGWTSTIPSNQDYSVQARHFGRANVVFVDGHVSSFDGGYLGCGSGNESLPGIRWETETGGINQAHMP
ncbi:MAG: type II secretion system protein [Verrucomicrobiota bacterium JB024]|jgi:prepilin-type N-terminal cleavage/methylation domain-containing protein/prepilin-type processing-associated H-X9-DG protein|nr:type II secretion system protein [Verrucomicrobiota bacterium JB024]